MSSAARIDIADWRAIVSHDDGTLPDGQVVDTDDQQWDKVLRSIAKVGWATSAPSEGLHLLLAVHPGENVQINVWRYDAQSIDFDFDLRELTTQQSLDSFCEFVRLVGQSINRDVTLTPEGGGAPYALYRHADDSFELLQ